MRICIDCGQEIKYGEGGWGGSNLHAKCRGKRGADSAKRQAEAAGRTFGSTRKKGLQERGKEGVVRAILLSADGFWAERAVDSFPPVYRVPWATPNGFVVDAESSIFLPSNGTIDFERIAYDYDAGVCVYLCAGGKR